MHSSVSIRTLALPCHVSHCSKWSFQPLWNLALALCVDRRDLYSRQLHTRLVEYPKSAPAPTSERSCQTKHDRIAQSCGVLSSLKKPLNTSSVSTSSSPVLISDATRPCSALCDRFLWSRGWYGQPSVICRTSAALAVSWVPLKPSSPNSKLPYLESHHTLFADKFQAFKYPLPLLELIQHDQTLGSLNLLPEGFHFSKACLHGRSDNF